MFNPQRISTWSGTKNSYLRGRRRFNGGLTSQAKKPQLPIPGPSGTGFAVADPWGLLEAGPVLSMIVQIFWSPRPTWHMRCSSMGMRELSFRIHSLLQKKNNIAHVCSSRFSNFCPRAAAGPPMPHCREWPRVAWRIRRLAVSCHAGVRHANLESLPSSQICMASARQLRDLHVQRFRVRCARGRGLRWWLADVHM